MKTILITILEGVEAKNILRTGIIELLLKDNNVRLVLLVKNLDRLNAYKKEFAKDRIAFALANPIKIGGFDAVFSRMKYMTLKTSSTKLKRKLVYQSTNNHFVYFVGYVLNQIMSTKIIRRAIRFLDYLLVKTNYYTDVLEEHKPDLVFAAHPFDERETHLIREAKRKKIKTICLINSWDKVTSRATIRVLADEFLVFNHIVKKELVKYDEVLEANIHVVGLPQYDYYFQPPALERDLFMKELSLPPANKLILYAPLGSSFTSSDWPMIDHVNNLLSEGKLGKDVSLLVRFQPNDFLDKEEINKRPWLHYDYPGKRFSTKRGVDWDMDSSDLDRLKNTLANMSLLVCFASSLSVDACVFDKPVVNIGFEFGAPKPLFRATQYFGREHYGKALSTGGIKLVRSTSEFCIAINNYLDDPSLDRKNRSRLIEEQCVFTDGHSSERIANLILKSTI